MYPIFNFKMDNNKPILLVGNSHNVMNKSLGKYINLDKFNIIRFNLCNVKDFEKYVGKGTTYLIINGITWINQRDKIPLENILISELPHTPNYKILNKHPTNLKFKSVQILPNYSKKYLKSYPTSGMMAISFFLQYVESIYIYGFSFSDSHYYNSNFRKGAGHHCYRTERNIVLSLMRMKKVIFLNELNCRKIPIYKTVNIKKLSSDNQSRTNIDKEIEVVSTKHAWNKSGKYFHFNPSDIHMKKGEIMYINSFLPRLNKRINVIIWGFEFGGKKDEYHGKVFDEEIQFKIGDKIKVIRVYPQIKVVCNHHKFGIDFIGKYFHFNSQGLGFKNEQTCTFYIPKINMKKKIIIWKNNNGGKKGDSHGRYVKGPKKYDFYKDDILVLLSP